MSPSPGSRKGILKASGDLNLRRLDPLPTGVPIGYDLAGLDASAPCYARRRRQERNRHRLRVLEALSA
eukprot:1221218-Amphidinium_carterae.1